MAPFFAVASQGLKAGLSATDLLAVHDQVVQAASQASSYGTYGISNLTDAQKVSFGFDLTKNAIIAKYDPEAWAVIAAKTAFDTIKYSILGN